MRALLVITILIPLLGCQTTPPGPPAEEAASIIADLDAGKADSARKRFDNAANEEGYADKLYPLLYEKALDRYTNGDGTGSSRILDLMSQRYTHGAAVRQALLYALFLERAGQAKPDAKLVAELEAALAAVREKPEKASPWQDLIQAQIAIDRGRLPEAKEALKRFHAAWDGKPDLLAAYVEDIDRYLRSH